MKAFSNWYEERKAMIDVENQIMLDKLAQGVDGIEWLVLQTHVTDTDMESLDQWIKFLGMYGHKDVFVVMKDALTMDADSFYDKYEFNWWISVKDTMTYLCLLKERDYNRYFNFLSLVKG